MPDVMELKAAVEKAIDVCIRDDVLAEFLRNNRSETISVSIYEYDEERTMRQMREEAFEDGVAAAGVSTIALIRKKRRKAVPYPKRPMNWNWKPVISAGYTTVWRRMGTGRIWRLPGNFRAQARRNKRTVAAL